MTDKKIIAISLTMVLFLSLLSYWRFKHFTQSLSKINLPKIELPEIKLETLPFSMEEEVKEWKEWISPDGKLKLKYSAGWVEGEKIFSNIFQQEPIIQDGKILFSAQKLDLKNQNFLLLMVEEIGPEKKLEEILEEIKGEGGEILNLEIQNEVVTFEVRIKKDKGVAFRAKEKIFFDKEKTYLISFAALEKNWERVKEIGGKIFEDIEFNP